MANEKAHTGASALLCDRSFQGFLWTQFLGAFNDNMYKMIVSVGAVELAASQIASGRYLAIAGAVFVLPFLLFSGWAGQIADRFSKTRVLQITKAFEIFVMLFGMYALVARSLNLLLAVLFLLAFQATLFSPAKYGVLPEMLNESQISKANGLLEFSTFAAIVLGTSAGSYLFAAWHDQPFRMGGTLLGIAIIGSVTSLFLHTIPASGAKEPFHWNPLQEVWNGTKRITADRSQFLTVAGISYFWFIGALAQLNIILLGKEKLHLTETHLGLLITALAIGIGIGSLAAGWLSGKSVNLGLVPLGASTLGFGCMMLATTNSMATASLCLAASGFSAGFYIVPLNAFLQEEAPSRERGRIQAANSFWNAIGIVLASGVLYLLHDVAHWTPAGIFAAVGILTLAGTVYISWITAAQLLRIVIGTISRLMFRIRIVGAENIPSSGPAVLVPNHVSYADAVILGNLTPRFIRFLIWEPIYRNRWLHPVCRIFQAIPLPAHSPKESLRALKAAKQELENGQFVCIFPEGALATTAHVQPFERGVEHILRGLESVPAVPIYLDGLWGHPLSKAPQLGGLRSWFRRSWFRHDVTVVIGEPIYGGVDAQTLQQKVIELGSQAPEYRKRKASTLPAQFVRSARQSWSRTAIADSSGREFSFGKSFTAALILRNWILQNCRTQRCVGLLLPASTGGAIANLGVTFAGKAAVNLNFTAGQSAMEQAVQKCSIQVVLSSRLFLEKANLQELPGTVFVEDLFAHFSWTDKLLAMIAAKWQPIGMLTRGMKADDLAAVIFSSGSTGTPKGVMLSHWNLLSNIESTAQVYQVNSDDCVLGALPFFHSFGYAYTLWFPLLRGFKAVFHANPTDAKTIGELAASHRATLLLSTPTFCLSYLRRCTREQFRSIRYLLVGAEKLRPALTKAFEERFGVTPLEGYGCTEMAPAVSVNGFPSSNGAYRPGSVGRPLPNVTVRIVDPETFEERTAGETGLLLVKGPSRMLGYLGEPQKTTDALHDEFYVTGDLAYVDSHGFLYIVDRISRFSKIGGEMVPHLKIEDTLAGLLGSGHCVVIGVPDERRGEHLAVLYVGTTITPAEMVSHLEESGLPALWIPKQNHFHRVESIPALGTGKVDLVAARATVIKCEAMEAVC